MPNKNIQLLPSQAHTIVIAYLTSRQTVRISELLPRLTPSTRASLISGGYVRTTADALVPSIIFLRNNTLYQLQTLSELAAIDRLPIANYEEERFSIQYVLLSQQYNQRITVTVHTTEVDSVPSLAAPLLQNQKVFASAG